MRILRVLFDFYLESSLHVALAVYALIRITFLKLNIPENESVAYFGFYGTIVGYNFIKYDELARIKKVSLTTTFKAIIVLSVFAAMASVYYFLQFNWNTKLMALATLGITIVYTIPFFPHGKNLRNWSGLKIYLVAVAWTGVTVILPIINAGIEVTVEMIFMIAQRFVFVFILMLIFEILDLKFDSVQLNTIPQKIGIQKTKYLAYVLIVVYSILEIAFGYAKNNNLYGNALIILALVTISLFLFVLYSNTNRNKYYTSFWVESISIVWWILLLVV